MVPKTGRKKKKHILARLIEWIARQNKKQIKKGNLCPS